MRCFAREGFHATTMSDVVRESEMSAGAVYRYFPSKTSLVRAGAGSVLTNALDVLRDLEAAPEPVSPDHAIRSLLEAVTSFADDSGGDLTRVAVSTWAEALRDEELRALASALYTEIRGHLAHIVTRWRDSGRMPADTDAEHVAQVLFACLPGFILERLIIGDVNADSFASGLRSLQAGAAGTSH